MQFITNLLAAAAVLMDVDTKKERGASFTEYVLLVVGLVVIIGALVTLFGNKLSTFIDGINL